MAVQTQMQIRRGTAASWTSTNPTLAAGEWGLETDTGKYKVGNGSTAWASLAYSSILPSTVTTKGDLLAASAASTVTRLGAGANGLYLSTDSAEATGLKWTTVAGTGTTATAKVANNTESGAFTYNITLPAGAYLISSYNSEGNLAANRSMAGIEVSFGTTKYSNVNWISRSTSWESSQRMPIIGYTGSQLTSVTVSTYPSGTWTSRSYSSFGNSTPSLRGVTFGNGNFVIFGGIGAGTEYVATSTDGVAWTSRTGAFGHIVTHVIYGDKFVGIGQNNAQVSTSTDGITWTSRYTAPFTTNPGRNMLSYVAGLANPYFLVNGSATYGYYLHSTDGITWASRAFLGSEAGLRYIAGNTAFSTVKVAAFKGNGTLVSWYQTSTDGLTWTSRPFATSYQTSDDKNFLAASNNRYVFTGNSGLPFTSTDGITWTVVSNFIGSNTSVVWNSAPAAKWLMAGLNSQLCASTDGVTWYVLDTQSMNSYPFAYGNGQWISSVNAQAGSGYSWYSSSGFGRIVGDLYVSIQSAGAVTTLS